MTDLTMVAERSRSVDYTGLQEDDYLDGCGDGENLEEMVYDYKGDRIRSASAGESDDLFMPSVAR